MHTQISSSPNLGPLHGTNKAVCFPVSLVFALYGLRAHLLECHCRLEPMECLHFVEMTCLLAARADMSEDHHGLCTMISVVHVLPDLMKFLVAVTSLVVVLSCSLTVLVCITDLVAILLNALPCLKVTLVFVAPLAIALPGLCLSQDKSHQVWNPALGVGTLCVITLFPRVVI